MVYVRKHEKHSNLKDDAKSCLGALNQKLLAFYVF